MLGVAVFLRFVQLGSDSLWVDEGFSVDVARKGIPDLIHQATTADANQPLYYVVLHFWIQLFGDSEFALRSLGALVGVALV